MRPIRYIGLLVLLLVALSAFGQNDARIAAQRKAIAELEQKIAREEAEIQQLKKGRSATEERARRLARQIEARSQLITETEQEAGMIRTEIARADSTATVLDASLERNRKLYASMVREAYRNHRYHNYLSYIFSAKSFSDAARRISALRELALVRERLLQRIEEEQQQLTQERARLTSQQRALDSVSRSATKQKERLQRDQKSAKGEIKKMSQRERAAMKRKVEQEEQLSVAISELRKLIRGNKEGASFSSKTKNLNLPVAQGKVKRYKGNMAEVIGRRGAAVRSIYEGIVVEVKRNRITAKYDVFVAHGEYISSYANMGTVAVKKGQKVGKNQPLGTVGASVNAATMETEYKIVFGIYSPNPKEELSAAKCFKQ